MIIQQSIKNDFLYFLESSEQLDKLLAGLDQLNGTLPDLNNTLITHSQHSQNSQQQQHVSRKFPVDPAQARDGNKISGNLDNYQFWKGLTDFNFKVDKISRFLKAYS